MKILNDRQYWTYFEEEYTTVHKLEDCFKAIACRNNDLVERIQYLEKVNKELKDEAFKDKTLQEMEKAYEEAKADNYRGFPITESERAAIDEWKKEHESEVHGLKDVKSRIKAGGTIGGRYKYEFVPTSIGTSGRIVCSCGESFEFSELG